MQKVAPGTVVAVLMLAATSALAADDRHTTKCAAGGKYDVELTSATQTAELTVKPRTANARVSRVLLRSPYKSEATALPTIERAGDVPGTYVATFDMDAIRRLPNGDLNVVVVTPDGERICRVKKKDRP